MARPNVRTVRRARREDLLPVFRIETRTFDQPWPFDGFERHLGEPGFLVAEDETADAEETGDVVGFAVANCIPTHTRPVGHLKDIAVREDFRRDGVGSALLSNAFDALVEQGAETVKLEVRRSNDPARELYRTFGFEHLHTLTDYYADGEDALVLVRSLVEGEGV